MENIMFLMVLSLLLCQQVSALRSISEEEYALFPPLRHNDGYSHCLHAEGGAYCVAGANIVTDQPSELYDKIMNFSFSAPRHFDYRKIRYGYCMTRRCKEFYTEASDAALEAALGACLNHTLQQEYGLRARVERAACYRHGDQRRSTALDRVAIAIYLTLIGLAVAGTLYDLLATKKDKGYLMCFSIPANWVKLTAPWPQDQSTARLIGINGLRFLSSATTIFVHSIIQLPFMVENVYSIEEHMESDIYKFVGNAHIIVQTFLFLSGMLMAHSAQASAESSPMTWKSMPKAILLRWLRLAPVYLAVVLYTSSLFKYIPQGLLWQDMVEDEMHDCQRDWLSMVFFYNNYVFGSQCNPHMWSTEADIHLHSVGLAVLLLPAGARAATMGLLIAAGMAASGLETYFRNLDGTFVTSGKHFCNRKAYDNYDSFNYLHKRTHTNMPAFFIGMAFGLFVYKWLKNSVDTTNYKRYRWVYWLTVPLLFAVMYAHSYLVLVEGERRSMRVRVLYAMFPKPIWGVLLAAIIFGMICRVENVYRRVLEWPGYVPLVRLSYSAFSVHMIIVRWMYASDTQLTHLSEINIAVKASGVVVLSFVVAVVVWLLVEAPSTNVIRKLFPEKKSVLDLNTATKKTE